MGEGGQEVHNLQLWTEYKKRSWRSGVQHPACSPWYWGAYLKVAGRADLQNSSEKKKVFFVAFYDHRWWLVLLWCSFHSVEWVCCPPATGIMYVSYTLIKIKNKLKQRQEFPIHADGQVKVFREEYNIRWRLDSEILRSVLSQSPQFCNTGFIKAKLNSYKCVNCHRLLSSFQKCIKIEKKTPKALPGKIQWSTENQSIRYMQSGFTRIL